MTSVSAIPDSSPTRAQLRLVMLEQWIRAGLALARGAGAGRGFVGGVVALWQVFQAVRLAIQLAQRLSELQGALACAARETAPAQPAALGFDLQLNEPPCSAAFLCSALGALEETIRDALGLAPERRCGFDAAKASGAGGQAERPHPIGRSTPPRGLPPDRPPGPELWRARPRRLRAPGALKPTLTPIAATAIGRYPLAARIHLRSTVKTTGIAQVAEARGQRSSRTLSPETCASHRA
jgi:hypothetical protein